MLFKINRRGIILDIYRSYQDIVDNDINIRSWDICKSICNNLVRNICDDYTYIREDIYYNKSIDDIFSSGRVQGKNQKCIIYKMNENNDIIETYKSLNEASLYNIESSAQIRYLKFTEIQSSTVWSFE